MISACKRQGSPSGGSTLTTSAPISASNEPASGPAMIWVQSRTRTPASAPGGWSWSLIALLLAPHHTRRAGTRGKSLSSGRAAGWMRPARVLNELDSTLREAELVHAHHNQAGDYRAATAVRADDRRGLLRRLARAPQPTPRSLAGASAT